MFVPWRFEMITLTKFQNEKLTKLHWQKVFASFAHFSVWSCGSWHVGVSRALPWSEAPRGRGTSIHTRIQPLVWPGDGDLLGIWNRRGSQCLHESCIHKKLCSLNGQALTYHRECFNNCTSVRLGMQVHLVMSDRSGAICREEGCLPWMEPSCSFAQSSRHFFWLL